MATGEIYSGRVAKDCPLTIPGKSLHNATMKTLEQYIAEHMPGATHQQVADSLGVSRPFLTQILNRSRYPSRLMQARINAATGGEVSPNSWLVPLSPKEQRPPP